MTAANTTRTINDSLLSEIRKGNLYALLSVCTDQELQPLAALIKDRVSSSLESDADCKKFPSFPSKYHMAIGDEIRAFGGNTVRNGLRGGGPKYQEVVVDVCKRLGVPFDETNIVKNEATLLNLYFDREWSTLPHAERDAAAARARTTAADDATSIESVVKNSSSTGIAAVLFGLGKLSALSSLTFTDPAYRVTTPCVLHIAYLRRKVLEASAVESNVLTPSPLAPRAIERSAELTVGETNSDSLVSLVRISDPGMDQWQPVDSNDGGISRLNPLLQAVPSLAAAQNVASTTYMEVVINGPLLKAKGTEGYRLITMVNGKPSHGTLLDPSTLSNIVNAGAMLQIASFALGQKHLADMKRELNAIKTAVQSISQFQQNERLTKLTGIIKYLDHVAPSVMSGDAPEALAAQIESHEPILLAIQGHLIEDIKTQTKAILDIKDPDTFGTEGAQKAISEHHALLAKHYEQAFLCIRARAANLQLASVLGLNALLKTTRRVDIRESLLALREDGHLVTETNNLMRKKIQLLSSVTNRSTTVTQRKLELLTLNEKLVGQLKRIREGIEQNLELAESTFRQQAEPARLLLKVEGERIVGLQAA
jgi:hypothetical protein